MRERRRTNASINLKEVAASRWAGRRLGRLDHERRVTSIATTLFDLIAPRHDLDASARRLLRLACVLHDVGRSIDRKSHPAEGARMIARDQWLPLSAMERRCVCYLTRYHRGVVPSNGDADWLDSDDDHKTMRRVLALLRAADALDSRAVEPAPRLVLALRGRRIVITCYLDQDDAKARRIYKRRKKFRLLEETLGCEVEVEVKHAEVVQAVA